MAVQEWNKTKAKRVGNYFVCPQCGGLTVDYDPHQKRFKCLNRYCCWRDDKEVDRGDYNYFTGSCGGG